MEISLFIKKIQPNKPTYGSCEDSLNKPQKPDRRALGMKETSAYGPYLQEEAPNQTFTWVSTTKDYRKETTYILSQSKRITSHKSAMAEVEHSVYQQNFFCLF